MPALAQGTRAEEIARQQAEKSRQLKPNVPTGMEKTLDRLEQYLTDPSTFYFTLRAPYPSSGPALGLAYRRAAGQARFNIGGSYSMKGYKLANASLRFPNLSGGRFAFDTRARWTDATQVPFYGLGSDTVKAARVNYGLRILDLGARATFKPVSWYRIGAGVGLQRFKDRLGAGTFPSIGTVGTPAAPGAFDEARYTQLTAFTAIDTRQSPGYTRRGGLYSVSANDFRDSGDAYSFRRIDGEIQQFLPLLREHWVLAFRGLMQTTTTDDGQIVPYYLLPSLGGVQGHRGFSEFRFQDRHMMLLTGEYRWIPSQIIDMAIFVDAGKVTRVRSDLDFTGLKKAYGIGVRFHGPHFTALRLDVARGKEGVRIHFTGGIAF
jgi:outer membrane protein assembly factor BamA